MMSTSIKVCAALALVGSVAFAYQGSGQVPCPGCVGSGLAADDAYVGPTCPAPDPWDTSWDIAVSVTTTSGGCTYQNVFDHDGQSSIQCAQSIGCTSAVTYSWGANAAGGVTGFGYYKHGYAFPRRFIGYSPTPGQAGSFSPIQAPDLDPGCGETLDYFITAASGCSGTAKAQVTGSCSACGSV